ncbi:MAG: RNA pseudouridine synthase [Bacteroidetes bacterium]|nr:RNA pseudouridine synthase [Bacteroidota bacterium]
MNFEPKNILFEDNHLIVVNKQPSQIVQGDKTGDEPLSESIKKYLKDKYHKPGEVFLGVVHRLDRPVSGIVIFARTSKALSRLNEMLKNREIRKIYWAVVKNLPPEKSAHLIHYIYRDEEKNKSFIVAGNRKGSQKAGLIYNLLGSSDKYHLLEVELLTGRHHQIRAQLAHIGCPIKGDLKYGFPRSNPDGSISLHSRKIEFMHPVKKELVAIEAVPPKDSLWDYFCLKYFRSDYPTHYLRHKSGRGDGQ